MTMTTLAVRAPPVPVPVRLDHVLLRRAFLVMGLALAMFAPFTPDPIEFAVGGFVPWLVLRIVGTPTLPAAVVFYLIWQWLQVYARTLVSVTDGEEMARGLYGPWVVDAYWYMLASIVVLALAIGPYWAAHGRRRRARRRPISLGGRSISFSSISARCSGLERADASSPISFPPSTSRWSRWPASSSSHCSCCSAAFCRPAGVSASCWRP